MNKNMMKQAQQLQARLAKAQDELGSMTAEATSGGGAVKVVATGDQRLESIKIDPEVVSPDDVEMLEDLILAAVNEGLEKSPPASLRPSEQADGRARHPRSLRQPWNICPRPSR